jgi:hypothetical protein
MGNTAPIIFFKKIIGELGRPYNRIYKKRKELHELLKGHISRQRKVIPVLAIFDIWLRKRTCTSPVLEKLQQDGQYHVQAKLYQLLNNDKTHKFLLIIIHS